MTSLLFLVTAAALGACRRDPPPPAPSVPALSPGELAESAEQAKDELERWTRERDELLQEACDPGELAEHTKRTGHAAIEAGKATVSAVFVQGEALFDRSFTLEEGLGTALTKLPAPGLSRVENHPDLGGPDALSCRECHGRAGDDGHGELHQRAWLAGDGRHLGSASPRVAPHVAGLGPIQALAAEMTAELATQGAAAKASPGTLVRLRAKGVDFGEIVARPDGSLDMKGAPGIDADLVVRPFGWKGTHATLRSFARAALPQHMGMEPVPLPGDEAAKKANLHGQPPSYASIEAHAYLFDRDGDHRAAEILEGQVTSLATYLALLDVPVILPPRAGEAYAAWQRGASLFKATGCARCHVPELPLRSTKWVERPDAEAKGIEVDLITDNQVRPRLEAFDKGRSEIPVALFSDLKRHDLGPDLSERAEGGVKPTVFVTRPLWGIADRRFFLHDGRARSFREAIRFHGGEAQAAADAFAELDEPQKRDLDVFLLSLRRHPQARISP